MQFEVVDLGDDAIQFVRQCVTLLFEFVTEGEDLGEVLGRSGRCRDGKTPGGQLLAELFVRAKGKAFDVTDGKRQEVERAALDDSRVEQLEGAGHGVARVAERAFAAGLVALLQRREADLGHDHFAADLDARRERTWAGELHRQIANGQQVARDVLATLAVAARQATHQDAVLVEQVGADAVELGFATPGQRGIFGEFEQLAGALDKGAHLIGRHQRFEAAHRGEMFLGRKGAAFG